MDAYYKGTIAATKTLISAQSKLDKNITKNADGTWELKEGVDRTTVSAEDYERAISDIANLNAWEKQVAQAEAETLQKRVMRLAEWKILPAAAEKISDEIVRKKAEEK